MKRRIPYIDIPALVDEMYLLRVQLIVIALVMQKRLYVRDGFQKPKLRWGNGVFDLFTGLMLVTVELPFDFALYQLSESDFQIPAWCSKIWRVVKYLLVGLGLFLLSYCLPEEKIIRIIPASRKQVGKTSRNGSGRYFHSSLHHCFTHYLTTIYLRLICIFSACLFRWYTLFCTYPVQRPVFLMNRVFRR
ncbi:hypothetical protein [Thermoflavifilum thermophilum]|uniref:Uncharacterized protein n=1 Tax=Thermoflavifilum thermophilum TaxID=1393122 RepID=A0A1I7N860_9BACT|nr:hypothetical protein [Thermoflavifilum thermophilum]SFV30763.1 hypothetical protein SAMN05660895_0883 [Thermoflavifilum thermophilum]